MWEENYRINYLPPLISKFPCLRQHLEIKQRKKSGCNSSAGTCRFGHENKMVAGEQSIVSVDLGQVQEYSAQPGGMEYVPE